MAERTTTININYKVNTADVDKATTSTQKAQAATDSLKNSAEQTSRAQIQGNRAALSSIEAMNLALARLKAQIQLTNTSDVKRITELSTQYKTLKSQIDAANKSLFDQDKALKQVSASSQATSTSFGQLYNSVKLFLTAGIVAEVTKMAIEMAKLSGNIEGVSRAFKNAIPNSISLLDDLRKSTHGTISDFELMQTALRAKNFHIPLEDLGKMLEFVAIKSQQTGQDITYLTESLINGLGRNSIRLLDNLQISVTELREKTKLYGTTAKAVNAIINEQMRNGATYIETSATNVDQLSAAWFKLKAIVSDNDLSKGIVTFLKDATNGLVFLLTGTDKYNQEIARSIAATQAKAVMERDEFKALGSNQQAKLDYIQQEINSRVQLIGRKNDEIAAIEKERELLRDKNPYDSNIEQLNKRIATLKDQKFIYASVILTLKEYLTQISKVSQSESDPSGLISRLEERIKSLNEELKLSNSEGEIKKLNLQIRDLTDELERLKNLGLEDLTGNLKDFKIKNALPKELGEEFKKQVEERVKTIEEGIKNVQVFADATGGIILESFGDKLLDQLQKDKKKIGLAAVDIVRDQVNSIVQSEQDGYDARLNSLNKYYDEQLKLAGNNDRAKQQLEIKRQREVDKLEKQRNESVKRARLTGIIIDTAAGIVRAFATLNPAEAIIQAAIVTAIGASEYAIANRAKYAKGVIDLQGPGTETSDSIPVMLSRRESVMNAQETKSSMGILKSIRANKLNDEILNKLIVTNGGVKYTGMDDTRIVKAIEKQRFPDIVRVGSHLYEAKKIGDTHTRFIRSKSMSK